MRALPAFFAAWRTASNSKSSLPESGLFNIFRGERAHKIAATQQTGCQDFAHEPGQGFVHRFRIQLGIGKSGNDQFGTRGSSTPVMLFVRINGALLRSG